MLDHPWNLVFLAGFVVYARTRHVYEQRAKGQAKIERHVDGVEKGLLAIVAVGTLLLPVLYVFTPLLSFADYDLPAAAHGCGAGVMVAALWLFWRSHADLGKNWSYSLELHEGHGLVTHGVYRRIRHPMYAAIFLFGLAQGLLLDNWLAGWSAIATFVPLYVVRVPREERMMAEHFGDQYRAYLERTPRIVPRAGTRP
jgi:protein-S-isoprenylcysteine O-methyltransferase Ste14